jgi:hypothetical protein
MYVVGSSIDAVGATLPRKIVGGIMSDPVTNFGNTAYKLARNPLGIIALFIVLVYGFAALVTSFSSSFPPNERLPLIYFLVIFPVLVLAVFGWLVSRHINKLYAPSDYRDENSFIRLVTDTAQAASNSAVEQEETDTESESLYDLRIKLEYKLAFLAKHILLNPETRLLGTFASIGSLRYDDLITKQEMRTAYAIMDLGTTGSGAGMKISDSDFLNAANGFVFNFRATVFHALVQKIIREKDPSCSTISERDRKRVDLLTKVSSLAPDYYGSADRIVPVYADKIGARPIIRQVERVRESGQNAIIVVPPCHRDAKELIAAKREDSPPIWTLDYLREQLRSNL